MKKIFPFIILVLLLISNCKNDKVKETTISPKIEDESVEIEHVVKDDTAEKIKTFLTDTYLKNDLEILQEINRKFQYHEVDLNHDDQNEIFVRFMSPYFCGTGGCTFLLLDSNMNMITQFSVTRAPIFVEQTDKNGWSILLVKDSGVFKELVYENGSYPNNPSVLPKAPYDAPSGHALILFDENYSNEKTITY
ncbi:hypothetical protein C1T31_10750 [Hanstruepera neustonica]|uniref:Uncharacterized protein n=1 Tax=Hanstruepera neustonica TaxID=1445657 RepID=A0A2K1DX89_9FLAO|nr:hypothetical protein [Hanstruepera neustonica]PNQ72619.1 hypothetical protein C1T31_10750 [Hanstruepera neustonica]